MKKVRKIVFSLAALGAVIPLAVGSTFANSAQMVENRFDPSGVLVASGESSVLEVESEKLYFDVPSLPVYNKEEDYDTTVTAEYAFVNPTQDTVKTKMGFLLGAVPDYFSDMTKFAPKVYKDETELTVETRHTFNQNGWSQTSVKDITTLSDSFYEDAFYNKDLTVTPYKLTYGNGTEEEKAEWEEGNIVYVRYFADLTLDKTKTRYISYSSTDSAEIMFYNITNEGYIYVLGEDNFDTLTFSAETMDWYGRKQQLINAPVTVEKQETITLKDLLLKTRTEESGISEIDWFNGAMTMLSKTSVSPITAPMLSYMAKEYFTMWYVYELELAPQEKAVNKVVSPIFPRYYGGGYEFKYYLSPAKCWASFKNLEVVIRTNYGLGTVGCSNDNYYTNYYSYQNVAGGYKLNFDELPDGELVFDIYEPYSHSHGYEGLIDGEVVGIVILIIIAVVSSLPYIIGYIMAIVLLIKHIKNKKK